MRRTTRIAVAAVAVHCLAALALAQPMTAFAQLGDLTGGTANARARAVSGDGRISVGGSNSTNGDEAARWTGPTGSGLGDLSGGTFSSEAYACSGDGSAVFGFGTDSSGNRQAFRWTTTGGIAGLGFFGGGYSSQVYACSADGLSACGENLVQLPPNPVPPFPVTQAFKWTQAGGLQGLGFLPGVTGTAGGELSTARGMSADGSVIVGWGFDAGGTYRAWRWTQATGMHDISGGTVSAQTRACSPDGLTVVGSILGGNSQPFLWTLGGSGVTPLGWLAGMNSGGCTDAINAGVRIIGVCSNTTVPGSQTACVWDRGFGWRSVRDVLTAGGIDVTGWNLTQAWAMSDDGRVIVGQGTDPSGNPAAWKASLPLPCRADYDGVTGLSVQDIFAFLNLWFAGDVRADFNGAGGLTVQDIFDYLGAWFGGC
jgi:probable HAF family extracellular repeat protein